MFVLPQPVLDRLPQGGTVVEVGVGGRFEVLRWLSGVRGDLTLVATDIHDRALEGAPEGVQTCQDDVTDPERSIYEPAELLFAQRCPEELQIPIARVARAVGAGLALTTFKDEWADVDAVLGPHTLLTTDQSAWRVWKAPP